MHSNLEQTDEQGSKSMPQTPTQLNMASRSVSKSYLHYASNNLAKAMEAFRCEMAYDEIKVPLASIHWRETQEILQKTVETLMMYSKGIMTADESTITLGSRLESMGIKNEAETRRLYRQMLFTSPDIEKYISGVILFHETIYQKADDGKQFVKLLIDRGIIPGVKVDTGVVSIFGTDGECTTLGLDDLEKRCNEYFKDGIRFAQWRCVLKIGDNKPSSMALETNANCAARYASICQKAGLVPIVEIDILRDGNHDLIRCEVVTQKVLAKFYKALCDYGVFIEGALLKTSMVTEGQACAQQNSPQEVAMATVVALQRSVPAAMPGIIFLSGGQSEERATLNLNAISLYDEKIPWKLTFGFGRALQASAMKLWGGKPENSRAAQMELIERAKACSEASNGTYIGGVKGAASDESLFVKEYKF